MDEGKEDIEVIIHKHLQGAASVEEEAVLTEWLTASPANKASYEDISSIWQQSALLGNEQVFDEQAAWAILEKRMKEATNKSSILQFSFFRRPFAVAAAFLLMLVFSGIAYYYFKQKLLSVSVISLSANNGNRQIHLPDGSSVTLRDGGNLKYNSDFGKKGRSLELSGEAYFDVVHNEKMVFTIRTHQSVVEVLGTAFLVKSSETMDQVFVSRGSVRFANLSDPNQQILVNTGQEATLFGGHFQKADISGNNYLSWSNGLLEFKDVSLKNMIETINDYYRTHIVLSDFLALKSDSIKVNFRFEKNNLDEVLQEIQLTTGWKAEKKADQILLH